MDRKTPLVEGAPMPRPGPAYSIVRLGGNQKIECYVCSPFIWGLLTHWIKRGKKGYAVECKAPAGNCLCDNETLPVRWRGYIHVYDVSRNCECFVELTPGVGEQMLAGQEERKSFRGMKVKIERTAKDNGRLNVTVFPYASIPAGLPESKDPRPYVLKLMSFGAEDLPE
jgi:hypothetical protein